MTGRAALLLAVAACTADAPSPPDTGPRMPPPDWAVGSWTVVRHLSPGVSALGDAEAAQWHGRVLVLSDSAAVGPEARCGGVSYRELLIDSDSVLVSHRLQRGALPLRETGTTQLDVLCDGVPWTAFGGRLLVTLPDTVLVPWDGVFFVLGRRPDAPRP